MACLDNEKKILAKENKTDKVSLARGLNAADYIWMAFAHVFLYFFLFSYFLHDQVLAKEGSPV